jgi:ATP-binding cassette subfamily B protein
METVLRNDLYAHLQRLPIAFHDGWQSGQLLSRATTDLSVIRRFLSFGLIFLVINSVTFVTVIVLLLRIYWPLGLVVAAESLGVYNQAIHGNLVRS